MKSSFGFGLALAALAASPLCAETRTWTGGAGDGNWTTPANWSPEGAPAANDVLKFNASVTFASEVPLAAGDVNLDVASGKTLAIGGVVSGPGGFCLRGAGDVVLTGDNTFTGEAVVSNGHLYARSEHALGPAADGCGQVKVYAWKKNPTPTLYFGNTTCAKPLVLINCNDADMGYAQFFQCEKGTKDNWVTGTLSVPSSYLRMTVYDNARLYFAGGGATGGVSWFGNRAAGAEIIVTNKPLTIRYQYGNGNEGSDKGWLVLAVPGTEIIDNSSATQTISGNRRTTVDYALTESSRFNQSRCTFDLCGTTQRVNRVFGRNAASDTGVITGTAGSQLTMVSTAAYMNTAKFTGAVSLVLDGKSANVVTLTGASTSTGSLTLAAGKKACLTGRWAGDVHLGSQSSLETGGSAALSSEADLYVASDAQLVVKEGETCSARNVYVDGEKLDPGFYAAEAAADAKQAAWISGGGRLYIAPRTSDVGASWGWVGAKGAVCSEASNWTNAQGVAELPDFDSGTATLVFRNAGQMALDRSIVVRRLEHWGDEAGQFDVMPAAGKTPALTLLSGSVCVTGTVTCNSRLNLSVATKIAGALAIEVRKGSGFYFWEGVSTIGSADVVKTGYGDFYLRGDANRIYGDVTVTQGKTYVYGADPLGGEGSFTQTPVNSDTRLYLYGATITRPVNTQNPNDKCGATIYAFDGTTNFITGPVKNTSNHLRVHNGKNATLELSGGVSPGGFFIAGGDSSGYVRISKVPLNFGSALYNDGDYSVLELDARDNRASSYWFMCSKLRIMCDWAISNASQNVYFGKSFAATVDLNGHEIQLAQIYRQNNSSYVPTNVAGQVQSLGPRHVTGGYGSKVTFLGSKDYPIGPTFEEAASFVRAGSGTTHFHEMNTSTGTLEVVSGTVVFEPGSGWEYCGVVQGDKIAAGTWPNCSRVTVTGGKLKLLADKPFGKYTDVELDGGVTTLGGTVVCRHLFVNGVQQKRGWYGKTELGDLVEGEGRIHALGDLSGTVLLLK